MMSLSSISGAALKRWLQRFADKAGLDKFLSCHSFRRQLITQLNENEWSYDEIQGVTGHRAIASITRAFAPRFYMAISKK